MTEREHAIQVQQQIVAAMRQRGWNSPSGRDPYTRQPLTLGMMYDRYATHLCVVDEKIWQKLKNVSTPQV